MAEQVKVLVVEDAADAAELVTALLQGGGYDTRVVGDGERLAFPRRGR